MSRYMRFCDIR